MVSFSRKDYQAIEHNIYNYKAGEKGKPAQNMASRYVTAYEYDKRVVDVTTASNDQIIANLKANTDWNDKDQTKNAGAQLLFFKNLGGFKSSSIVRSRSLRDEGLQEPSEHRLKIGKNSWAGYVCIKPKFPIEVPLKSKGIVRCPVGHGERYMVHISITTIEQMLKVFKKEMVQKVKIRPKLVSLTEPLPAFPTQVAQLTDTIGTLAQQTAATGTQVAQLTDTIGTLAQQTAATGTQVAQMVSIAAQQATAMETIISMLQSKSKIPTRMDYGVLDFLHQFFLYVAFVVIAMYISAMYTRSHISASIEGPGWQLD